eukprot:jgi/Tetstr1/448572/TSEL_035821.t1
MDLPGWTTTAAEPPSSSTAGIATAESTGADAGENRTAAGSKLVVHLAPGWKTADVERALPHFQLEYTSPTKLLIDSGAALVAEADFELDAEDNAAEADSAPDVEAQWGSLSGWLNQALQDFNDAMERAANSALSAGAAAVGSSPEAASPPDPSPSWGRQWGMQQLGLLASKAYWGAPGAWATTTGSRSVKVCVVDSGIDTTHPDLVGNLWVNAGEVPGDGIDNDGNGWIDDVHGFNFDAYNGDVSDMTGHGTHIAGVIGAMADDAFGISGVNKQVSIMTCKVLNRNGKGFYTNVIKCIDYCSANGAKITSMSLGFATPNRGSTEALRLVRPSDLLVFSAGNGNIGPIEAWDPASAAATHIWPVSYSTESMISVAALNRAGRLWSTGQGKGSNWGPAVDISAPGEKILSTLLGGAHGYMTGTSMAVPFVAGTAALLLAADPSLRPSDLKRLLMDGAVDTPGLAGKVQSGVANAALSMDLLNQRALIAAEFGGGESDVAQDGADGSSSMGPSAATPEPPAATLQSPALAGAPKSFLQPPSVEIVSPGQPFPLQYTSIQLRPDEDGDVHMSCIQRGVTAFPVDPAGGARLDLFAEDPAYSLRVISLGRRRFPFYGHKYDEVVLSAHGFVGFSIEDVMAASAGLLRADLPTQLAARRISLLFTDELAPGWGGGEVSHVITESSLIITWDGVPSNRNVLSDTNSMQLQLFFDGSVQMTYLEVATARTYRAVGVSDGRGMGASGFVAGSFQHAESVSCQP